MTVGGETVQPSLEGSEAEGGVRPVIRLKGDVVRDPSASSSTACSAARRYSHCQAARLAEESRFAACARHLLPLSLPLAPVGAHPGAHPNLPG